MCTPKLRCSRRQLACMTFHRVRPARPDLRTAVSQSGPPSPPSPGRGSACSDDSDCGTLALTCINGTCQPPDCNALTAGPHPRCHLDSGSELYQCNYTGSTVSGGQSYESSDKANLLIICRSLKRYTWKIVDPCKGTHKFRNTWILIFFIFILPFF